MGEKNLGVNPGRGGGNPQGPRIVAQDEGRRPLNPVHVRGKHLRFSDDDIAEIMKAGARQPVTVREGRPRRTNA
jgi:hypothetical protein